ncbi:hypothetical protein FGE12_12435 [Aggregicoccus sp. 17bor-14]|uniref:hypothetical protein n=1 Tax=Myxococcaceae TaxID=31 RepID=UPI00129CC2C6|nr:MULTISPECIES: hypothetical protein [Myxococcaceae]MBF5043198.1 hypothetical protein [Simulacricoccus sp. 17bor-14]MRI88955.1 hypothetical protein [Aggregicoccus sp. 17bor-14]
MTRPWCRIESFDDLARHQAAILERIEQLPSGGNLFLLHPFLLLEDLGVELGEDFKRGLVAKQPALATLSEQPYRALRAGGRTPQAVQVRLRGLFHPEGHPPARKRAPKARAPGTPR